MNLNSEIALLNRFQGLDTVLSGRAMRFQYVMFYGDDTIYDKDRLAKLIKWLSDVKEIMADPLTKEEKEQQIKEIVQEGQKIESAEGKYNTN